MNIPEQTQTEEQAPTEEKTSLQPKTADITLGEVPYTLHELPWRQAAKWRNQFTNAFRSLLASMKGITDVAFTVDLEAVRKLDPNAIEQLLSLLDSAPDALFGAIDAMLDLVIDYSPELREKRQEIEETAYADEIKAAFVQVVKLAFPFWPSDLALLGAIGRLAEPTSQSLPSPNGAST